MKIALNILLYFIQNLHPKIIGSICGNDLFAGVKYFFIEPKTGEDAYVYVGSLRELWENREALSESMTVIAVEDILLSEAEIGSFPCRLILVDGCHSVPYLVNQMIEIFNRLANWDKMMHIAALEGEPVQTLVDISETLLAHPVIIFDASFDVLAFTKKADSTYKNFHITVEKGYTDAGTMALVRKRNIFSRLKKGEPLVAPAAGDEQQVNVYLCFYSDQTLLGYACIFHVDSDPAPGYLDLLRLFGENISFCLKRDYQNHRYGHMMFENFLQNLMHPTGMTRQQIEEQAKNIENLPVQGRFVLGVFRFKDRGQVPMTYVARQIHREMWDVRTFIYEEHICLLKILADDGIADALISSWEKNNIDRLMGNYEYIMGVSNTFYQLMDLRYAYIQAQTALQFCKKGQKYSLYSDCYYEHLFLCMEKVMPIVHMQSEVYRQLKAYDDENRTEYCKIVVAYLRCDCNATHTAQKLFLHRNTIRNAIQFVEERWKIDIGDIKVRKSLVLSRLIDDYLEQSL